MLSMDGDALTQMDATARGAVWLAEMHFVTGTVRFTTHAVDIPAAGYTWTGYGQLVTVGDVREAEDGGTPNVVLGLSIVSAALLAAATTNVENYRGRRVRLYLQVIGTGYQPIGAPRARWAGVMNKVRVPRSANKAGSSGGAIEMVCSRTGANRARAGTGLRHTHAQHLARFPGDNGCEYIQSLIDKPALWLSKRFQQQQR